MQFEISDLEINCFMNFDSFSLAHLTHWGYLTLLDTLTLHSGLEPRIGPGFHKVSVFATNDHLTQTIHFKLREFGKAAAS